MNNKKRRKITIENVYDVSSLGHISKEELMFESERYEPEKYNPLDNIDEKTVLIPDNRTEVITIRVTKLENELLKKCASDKKISKSAFLRAVVLNAIKEPSNGFEIAETTAKYDVNNSLLKDLVKRVDRIEKQLGELTKK